MTTARSEQIDLSATPYYHCIARCVRRSYLCGQNIETGQDCSHRKQWIVDRLKFLASIFAIKICAYAVMSNHYHVVLFVHSEQAKAWSDEDIKERWAAVFPKDAKQLELLPSPQALQKLTLWRGRLSSISWFMRCLNETIARRSNQEDECTGRFWEGRFKSQALLDAGALLSAMAYVDLNPIRAQCATTPEESEFTSIYERIEFVAKQLKKAKKTASRATDSELNNIKQPDSLMAFKHANATHETLNFTLADYLALVDYTGRILREDKRGAIPQTVAPILERLNLSSSGWLSMVRNVRKQFSYAVGNIAALRAFGQRVNERGAKGISSAKQYYLNNKAA